MAPAAATPASTRQLRPRNRPEDSAPPPPAIDSDDDFEERKGRKRTRRSVQRKKKKNNDSPSSSNPDGGDDVAAAGGGDAPLVAGTVTYKAEKANKKKPARSVQNKRKAVSLPKADGAAAHEKEAKKVKSSVRTVVKADVGSGNNDDEKVGDDEIKRLAQEEVEEAEGRIKDEPEIERKKRVAQPRNDNGEEETEVSFEGEPVLSCEAKKRWPHRYMRESTNWEPEQEEVRAKRHFLTAKVDNVLYELGDDVYVKAGPGVPNYIGRITEFFEGLDCKMYFTAQWFFRAEDTVIRGTLREKHDPKRVFLSEEKNDNVLECILSKIRIIRVEPNINLEEKRKNIPECDLYYDMSYNVQYSSFENSPPENINSDNKKGGSDSTSTISSDDDTLNASKNKNNKKLSDNEASSSDKLHVATLLDLYAGCGGMSTGLCLGAALSGLNLETKWAVDINEFACESLKKNHPRTEVRNEKTENFLALLKEWKELCDKYDVYNCDATPMEEYEDEDSDDESWRKGDKNVFEVQDLVGICYGNPNQIKDEDKLYFRVKWKGYGSEYDTWEPEENLDNCEERIKRFVAIGYRNNILPLPGKVDVLCGGPPCQGISGFNRFRDKENPLNDEKNQQMIVYMEIVEYLKPKYVLMENVVDILKFSDGLLGRYALSRLVAMNYQARLGLMVAGCYGLPQFRMRVFLWGALPTEVLPQFPLPTHDVIVRGGVPNEFLHNIVALDETQDRSHLKRALVLEDALSDLPPVKNGEKSDEMDYGGPPKTEFQRFIRLTRRDMLDRSFDEQMSARVCPLYDHQPLELNKDDFQRVCRIPKKKGANFRDLPGLKVGLDNIVYRDPDVERELLPSGKPLVPEYAISFIKGRSLKPFGRLWWDETVPTVVTRAEPHNQIILHPEQDRVLTIRENARLQGFPDYYKLEGSIKQRYIQVGNAVAVPVSRGLGCALGRAFRGMRGEGHLFTLPDSFSSLGLSPSTPSDVDA